MGYFRRLADTVRDIYRDVQNLRSELAEVKVLLRNAERRELGTISVRVKEDSKKERKSEILPVMEQRKEKRKNTHMSHQQALLIEANFGNKTETSKMLEWINLVGTPVTLRKLQHYLYDNFGGVGKWKRGEKVK